MRIIIIAVLVLISFFSCTKKEKLDVDVSEIEVKVQVKRFEQVFYKASASQLPKIKKEYHYLFPHNIDSIWVKKMQDKDEQELFAATQEVYPTLKKEKLRKLFKYVKYYYPKFKEPKVITINSNVDLEQKVVYADSLLFISLDAFLGTESEIYQDYPAYIKQNLTKEHLIVAAAEEIAKSIQFKSKDRRFLAKIIQAGKLMYAIESFLPEETEANKIGYTEKQLEWVKTNEAMIWQYFMEKKILYKANKDLAKRFIERAPFTKFYLDIDSESPGRVGVWIGWQIVQSFMKHNEVELAELMQMENEQIFKKSKYRPRE